MTSPPRVTFMIVGVQKGGTTALFDYLGDHTDIALSDTKEVHFFDDDTHDWARPDYTVYHAHFPPADPRPCGEATPIYSYWPNSLERIRAYNPAMRLIMVLRDPVERAWSHWRMEYSRRAETEPFAWCIREGRQRLFAADPWGHHREYSYVERGFYGAQMEQLLALYPRDQILVLTSEGLRDSPAATLDGVRRFLGLSTGAAPVPRDVHVGMDMDYPSVLTAEDIEHLRRVYKTDNQSLKDMTGIGFG